MSPFEGSFSGNCLEHSQAQCHTYSILFIYIPVAILGIPPKDNGEKSVL